jgi:putative N6-adenine-specific DNA methylase/tRNA (guanine6-N2)-methyltransferase
MFTTNPGLEPVAYEEFLYRAGQEGLNTEMILCAAERKRGRVEVEVPGCVSRFRSAAFRMRSIHHILQPVHSFRLEAGHELERIEAELRRLRIPALEQADSFRVSCMRLGEHPFTSPEVERIAGAALVQRNGTRVDLECYEVNVRVDVVDRSCTVALQLTEQPLSKRFSRSYLPRVAIKPNVAFAALWLARLSADTESLADPFCGSGTLLLEAGSVLPGTFLWGSDNSPRSVEGAERNLASSGLLSRARIFRANALRMSESYPRGRLRAIVTNPPYGIRMGRGVRFTDFYGRFLRQASQVLDPDGRLCVLVGKRRAFNTALRRTGTFRTRHVRVVEMNNTYPAIFVLEPVGCSAEA